MKLSLCSVAAICLLVAPQNIEGHGHMYSPRSRNWVAYEDGVSAYQNTGAPGVPLQDHCYYCLNTKAADDVCGVGNAGRYDHWLDVNGDPMPWDSQATYTEGDIIEIKSNLHTPHWGHQDVMICPDGDDSTQECFESNPLEFIEDVSYGAPKDPNNPTRGHFTGAYVDFTMKFKLPMGVTGDKVLMQWRYVTANNCWPPGYENYPYEDAKGGNSMQCTYPLDPTGATGTGKPEQFWNCAEITILPSGPTPPTTPPPTPPPSPTPPPASVPAPTPSGQGCCSWPPYQECSQPQNTWCQESKDRCEGSCSGQWLSDDAPQPAPVAQPVAAPVMSPVKQPSSGGGRGCCSINFKTCHHPANTFCWETEENCRGPCGKYWLPTGAIDGCTAAYESCTNDDECCSPATCQSDGHCGADGWDYTAAPTNPPVSVPVATPTNPPVSVPVATPTNPPVSVPVATPTNPPSSSPPTKSPVNNPTLAPVAAPTPQVGICKSWCVDNAAPWSTKCTWQNCSGCSACGTTSSPTTIAAPAATSHPSLRPTTTSTNQPDVKCCTWDFYHCGASGMCNENEQNCQGICGGAWMTKADPAMQCIEKYGQCTAALDGCCNSLICSGNENYKQCL